MTQRPMAAHRAAGCAVEAAGPARVGGIEAAAWVTD
jgi:hypothetical protein